MHYPKVLGPNIERFKGFRPALAKRLILQLLVSLPGFGDTIAMQNVWPEQYFDMGISASTVGEVTQLLSQWNAGSADDQARLFDLIYPELKRIAEFRMRKERPDHTLQATALVNEFVVQLWSMAKQPPQSRLHFLAIASRAMRRILVDYARAHNAEKRGGPADPACKVEFAGITMTKPHELGEVLEINDLLNRLADQDQRMADVVELRYFGGLSHGEIAETLGIGERTVKRDWELARAWLYAQWNKGKSDAGRGVGRDQADF